MPDGLRTVSDLQLAVLRVRYHRPPARIPVATVGGDVSRPGRDVARPQLGARQLLRPAAGSLTVTMVGDHPDPCHRVRRHGRSEAHRDERATAPHGARTRRPRCGRTRTPRTAGRPGTEAGVHDERQRIAGEIHDTIAQGLTGVIMQLEAADQATGELASGATSAPRRSRSLAQRPCRRPGVRVVAATGHARERAPAGGRVRTRDTLAGGERCCRGSDHDGNATMAAPRDRSDPPPRHQGGPGQRRPRGGPHVERDAVVHGRATSPSTSAIRRRVRAGRASGTAAGRRLRALPGCGGEGTAISARIPTDLPESMHA